MEYTDKLKCMVIYLDSMDESPSTCGNIVSLFVRPGLPTWLVEVVVSKETPRKAPDENSAKIMLVKQIGVFMVLWQITNPLTFCRVMV